MSGPQNDVALDKPAAPVPAPAAPATQDVEPLHARPVPGRVHPVVRRDGAALADPLGGSAVGDDVADTLRRRRGKGAPLDRGLAGSLGQQYGSDLSGVRVHTDAEANTLSRSMQAVAFTHGHDVYFSSGSYSPGTAAGQRLIAHEAAHVAQGHSGRATGSGSGLTIGNANDPVEAEADRMADSALGAIRRQAAAAPAAPATGHDTDDGCVSCAGGDVAIHRTAHVAPQQDLGAVRRQAAQAGHGVPVIRRGFFSKFLGKGKAEAKADVKVGGVAGDTAKSPDIKADAGVTGSGAVGGQAAGAQAGVELAKPAKSKKPEREYPATVAVGKEKVKVASMEEEDEVKTIVAALKKYGIALDSKKSLKATAEQFPDALEEALDKQSQTVWEVKELRGLLQAAEVYAPILGSTRKKSGLKDSKQLLTSIGKINAALDLDFDSGDLDNGVLGEYFEGGKNIAMYDLVGDDVDRNFVAPGAAGPDNATSIKATAIHEMAHALVQPLQLANWVKALDYWKDEAKATGTPGAEAPPTDYGQKNAAEDLCESVSMYFINKASFQNQCPVRAAFVDKVVKAWAPAEQKVAVKKISTAKGKEAA